MSLFQGLLYNLKGLLLGVRTPSLLFLGILRFVIVVLLTIFFSGLILVWHQEILNMIWKMPEPGWLVFLWKMASWLLSIFLAAFSALFSYLLAQIFFGVFIMDYMSRITERILRGGEDISPQISLMSLFFHLVRQEIPRAIIPLFLMFIIMIIGFLTPLGPAVALISSLAAASFLAWDNTDLVPARQMHSFKDRFRYFKKNILFHVGFGLWFLIPWFNILFLSFAPVGGTMYYYNQTWRKK